MHSRKHNRNPDCREPDELQQGRACAHVHVFLAWLGNWHREGALSDGLSRVSQVEAGDTHRFLFSSLPLPLPFRFMRNPRWIWSRRSHLSAVPQAARRWVWGPTVLQGARLTFQQGSNPPLSTTPAVGFHSSPVSCHSPLTIIIIFIIIIISTSSSLNYFPHSPWNTSVLAISTHNVPLEVSQTDPAHQMFRSVISGRQEGGCLLLQQPLECWAFGLPVQQPTVHDGILFCCVVPFE